MVPKRKTIPTRFLFLFFFFFWLASALVSICLSSTPRLKLHSREDGDQTKTIPAAPRFQSQLRSAKRRCSESANIRSQFTKSSSFFFFFFVRSVLQLTGDCKRVRVHVGNCVCGSWPLMRVLRILVFSVCVTHAAWCVWLVCFGSRLYSITIKTACHSEKNNFETSNYDRSPARLRSNSHFRPRVYACEWRCVRVCTAYLLVCMCTVCWVCARVRDRVCLSVCTTCVHDCVRVWLWVRTTWSCTRALHVCMGM